MGLLRKLLGFFGLRRTVMEVATPMTQGERDEAAAPYLGHLLYEIQIMGETCAIVAKLATQGPAVLYIGCQEACLVHARLLIEFLYGRPKANGLGRNRDSGDIKPSMFTDSWNPTTRQRFDPYLKRLDQHLVHLTKARDSIGVDDGSWAMDEIPRILGALSEFAATLTRIGSAHAYAVTTAVNIAASQLP